MSAFAILNGLVFTTGRGRLVERQKIEKPKDRTPKDRIP